MASNTIKFNYLELGAITNKVWSKQYGDYIGKFGKTATQGVCWTEKGVPFPCEQLTINEILKRVKKLGHFKKGYGPVFQMCDLNRFYLNAFNGYDVWNGCIMFDIDYKKSEILNKLAETNPYIWEQIYEDIRTLCEIYYENNFLFIEKSSSLKGIHIIFYIDGIEKTEENFKLAYNMFKKAFFNVFTKDEQCRYILDVLNEKGVFDESTNSLSQKCFITCYDCYINQNCNGFVNINKINAIKSENNKENILGAKKFKVHEKTNYTMASYKASDFKGHIEYKQRLNDYYALCKLWRTKELVDYYFEQIAKNHYTLDKDQYSYKHFLRQVDTWYDGYDIERAKKISVNRLKKYGFTWIEEDNVKENYSSEGNGFFIPENSYLSEEYYDLIVDEIQNNNVVTIVGGTGIGKTETIKKLAIDNNAIILVPYNDLRNLYDNKVEYIDKDYINSLFAEYFKKTKQNINIVSIETGKENPYNENMPNCMVYDQFMKLDNKMLKNKQKMILIDESHLLFEQRNFRRTLIDVLEKLNEIKDCCKIVLISATPLDEVKYLNCEKTLEFWKSRPIINTQIVPVNNIKTALKAALDKNRYNKNYDRIIIYSDKAAKFLYYAEQIYKAGNADKHFSIIHTQFSDPENPNNNCNRIITTELLHTKITVATSLAYNGLNFKNKGEHNLVLIDYNAGSDNVWKIVQAAGRLRNSTCDLVVFYHGTDKTKQERTDEIIENRKIAELFANLDVPKNVFTTKGYYVDERYVKAISEICDKKYSELTIEDVKNSLESYGYFKISIENEITFTKEEMKYSVGNPVLNKISELISYLIKETPPTELKEKLLEKGNEDFIGKEYYKSTIEFFQDFSNEWNFDYSLFNKLAVNYDLDVTKKLIKKLDYTFNVATTSDEKWDKIVSEINLKGNSENFSDITIKRFNDEIKKGNETREIYCDLVKFDTHTVSGDVIFGNYSFTYFNPEPIVDKFGELTKEKNKQISEKRANAGKKGGEKKGKNEKKIQDIETGIVYNSINEAVEQTGKGRATISRWLKNGKFIYL